MKKNNKGEQNIYIFYLCIFISTRFIIIQFIERHEVKSNLKVIKKKWIVCYYWLYVIIYLQSI